MTTEAADGGRAWPLRERTVPALLRRQATRFGDRALLAIGGVHWSHAEAWPRAARRAAALHAAGIERGDRVALMCGNRIELLETFLACGWIGAVAVPLNTASMGPQIGHALADSGAVLLVAEAAYLPRLEHAELSRCALRRVWVLDGGTAAAPAAPAGLDVEPWPDTDDALAPCEAGTIGPGDLLAILYTSGTTGAPKGVMCPHAQYVAWGLNTARILGLRDDDVLCTTLPLFHINALNTFAQAAVTGSKVVYESRFSASGFWAAMKAHDASVVYLLGAMVPILLAQPPGPHERGHDGAHRVRIGLGPGVPAAAAEAFRARTGVDLIEGYGSTETNFVIASRPGAPRDGSMGHVQPGFEARVVDEHDAERPPGEAGELVLRADEPYAFALGYWGLPQQTVDAWRNLWFHTGDRVVREADGAFRFVDRLKDAIRRRGENISSFEVEQVLLCHPDVAAAAVFPVRSELAEDEVMAAVVPKPGVRLDADTLWHFCEPRLPYFAVPRYVDIVDELPRTENGKVQKFRLRERGLTPTTRDRGAQARRAA